MLPNYLYTATVTRVVDGDTIDCCVDLGFKISINLRFRLADYDSPETWRPSSEEERVKGELATEYLNHLIKDSEVRIRSHKKGKYRYLATVYLPNDFESINQKMINAGHIKESHV